MLALGLVTAYFTTILASPLVNIRVDETTANDGGYRLPKTQIPSRYEINLTFTAAVFDGHETFFEGIVRITFQVTEKKDSIKIHAPVEIFSIQLENIPNAIGDASLNTTTDILTIPLNMILHTETNYVIIIKYRGGLGIKVFEGIYRSSYKNKNGTYEYLVTTQFQAIYARKAFPCFDEPKLKARFVISITYPRGFNALSNTPQVGSPMVNTDGISETATFAETPIMSTYLVAFIVSKFTCTAANTDIDVPYRICSRNELASLRTFASEYGPKFMRVLENITAFKFKDHHIGKIDHIGIPDFESEGMENYGVVTYEEGILLYDQNQPSFERTDITLSIMAHEISHMWFGNLVTCEWWDYIFLNEGLASYFQFFVPAQISELKYYEMDKQFIVEEHQFAFLSDSSTDSLALTSAAVTSSEVQDKFDDIAYEKGAAIFRMVENFMGTDNFHNGIREYLRAKVASSAVPDDLWRALQPYYPEQNLSQILNNWINHPGFPLVTVTSNGSDVILSQKRFLNDGTDNIQWYVPISFTLSSDVNKFEAVYPKVWQKPGFNTTIPNVLQNASWIILNNKESAFYRVNYDSNLWKEIRNILYTNHNEISVLNRAQIVDDSLNLAKARILTYSEAFKNVIYLINETEYYPWVSAFRALRLLKTRLGENTLLGKNVDWLMLELMEGVYNSVSFTKLDENDHIYMLKLNLVLGQACKLKKPDCVKTAKRLFKTLRQGKSINKNLKPIVYCNGLRYSNNIEEDWVFLWKKYQSTEIPTEKKIILKALGCTKNITILKKYLKYSMNDSYEIRTHDVPTVWSSVYSSSSEGIDVALDYLLEYHEKLYQCYPRAASIVSEIVDRLTTKKQIEKLDDMIDKERLHSSLKSATKSAVNSAKVNIAWTSAVTSDLEEYFNKRSNIASFFKFPTSIEDTTVHR